MRFGVLIFCILSLTVSSAGFAGVETAHVDTRFLPKAIGTTKTIRHLPQALRIFKHYDETLLAHQRCVAARSLCPSERLKVWSDLVRAIKDKPKLTQLGYVNGWFNRMPYREDDWVYAHEDHWAALEQFLQYSGDCEDFALAKYMTLRVLGFSTNQLKIAMVYDVFSGTDHSFLTARIGANEFILDNRDMALEPARFVDRYQPYYSFNERKMWVYNRPVVASKIRKGDQTVLPGNR